MDLRERKEHKYKDKLISNVKDSSFEFFEILVIVRKPYMQNLYTSTLQIKT